MPIRYPVAQGAAADPQQRLDDNGQHRRLDAEEYRCNQRQIAVNGIEDAQAQHHQRARQNEQDAGDQPAGRSVQEPAEVSGELLRFRARQQHAVVESMQKPLLADPTLLVDQHPVHQRDLPGRAPEAEQANFRPDLRRFGKARPRQRESVSRGRGIIVVIPPSRRWRRRPAASRASRG